MNQTIKNWFDRRVSLGCKTETWQSPRRTKAVHVAWDLTDYWGLEFDENFDDEPHQISLHRLVNSGWKPTKKSPFGI